MSVDIDITCNGCKRSMDDGDRIFCNDCAGCGPMLMEAIAKFPMVFCNGCNQSFRSIYMVEKIVGQRCLACALKYETELLTQVVA